MTGTLQPSYYDEGGNPWWNVPPIEHEDNDAGEPAWEECPVCGEEADYRIGGDHEGSAYPDEATCSSCDYHWSE